MVALKPQTTVQAKVFVLKDDEAAGFILGRRAGSKRTTFVEIRRV